MLQALLRTPHHSLAIFTRPGSAYRSDPRALADFLLSSFEGAMLRTKVEKDGSPLDHFMTVIFSRVLT